MDICQRWHQRRSFRERPCQNLRLVFDPWGRHMEIRKYNTSCEKSCIWLWKVTVLRKKNRKKIMEKYCGKKSLYFSNMLTICIKTENNSMKKKPSGINRVKLHECREHTVQYWFPVLLWAEQKDIQFQVSFCGQLLLLEQCATYISNMWPNWKSIFFLDFLSSN